MTVPAAIRPAAPDVDNTLVSYIAQGRVVPWIGAGFSAPLGYPNMRVLLMQLLDQLHHDQFGVTIESDDIAAHLVNDHRLYVGYRQQLVKESRDYAEIASDIRKYLVLPENSNRFHSALRSVLNRVEDIQASETNTSTQGKVDDFEHSDRRKRSSLGHYFLRALGFRRIVTTNYDKLIEHHVLPHAAVITGQDVESVDYYSRIATNDEVIFKIHGDIGRPTTIPFSEEEFSRLYCKTRQIQEFLTKLYNESSILFIGTSLSRSEEYYKYLKQLFGELTSRDRVGTRFTHFALLPSRDFDQKAKEDELNSLGIRPLWYQTNDREHSQIFEYLSNLSARRRPTTALPLTPRGKWRRMVYDARGRPEYLHTQLSFEQRARVVTFVTPDVTNALAPDSYLQGICQRQLAQSPIYGKFGSDFCESVLRCMTQRRDNLVARATRGELNVRALCSRAGVERALAAALVKSEQSVAAVESTPTTTLALLIERYRCLFDAAQTSPCLDIRLSDGFLADPATSYAPDSYALIVCPYANGRSDLVLAFATQASHASFETHLIEINTELVLDRAAHAEEMWWSSTPELESLEELRELLRIYAAKCC